MGLKGHAQDTPTPQPKATGWHVLDWACELVGTAFQLFVGFGAVAVLESPHSPLRSALPGWVRLVLIGVAFGLLAAAVAISPVGRRSGAHLNPAVTLGFFLRGHTRARDLAGYALAQVAGALVAAFGFEAAWQSWASSVNGARTAPATGLPVWGVIGIEAALTFGLLTVVFSMVSSTRTARWTPTVVTAALAGLIWAGAAHTGASMNPARTLAPDLATGAFPALWAYFVGPLCGAALAAGAFAVFARERTTLTAKLFHDSDYPSVHATALPAKPHRGTNQERGQRGDTQTSHPERKVETQPIDHSTRLTRAIGDITAWLGSFPAILASFVLVMVWFIGGLFIGLGSNTYQLVINTTTTIVTFLMVFIIQNTQNRDGTAVQAKLDAQSEVLRQIAEALEIADDEDLLTKLVGVEDAPARVISEDQNKVRQTAVRTGRHGAGQRQDA